MSNQKLTENQSPTSKQEFLKKAEKALTPEQYVRMRDRALDKIGIMQLSSMNLEALKSELPKIVAGDHEEADIMDRLEREFPGIKTVGTAKKKTELGLWDSMKDKVNEVGDWMYEKLVPDRFKKAQEISKQGASTTAVVATVLAGETAGNAVQSAEKVLSWWDRFKNDPSKFFSDLMDAFKALFTGDTSKLRAIFSSTMDALGVSTDTVERFIEKMGFPKTLIKTAKNLLLDEKFNQISYGKVEKIWKEYQKTPSLDIMKKLGISGENREDIIPILEQIFSKNSKNIVDGLAQKGNNNTDIADLPIGNLMKYMVG